jgi:spore maturation protein CgeB
MTKNILLLGTHYPLAILSYFRHALEKRPDVRLYTAGGFTNNWIPWGGGMYLDMKYVKPVNLVLPQSINRPSWEMVNRFDVNFDLVLCVDAGFHLSSKPDTKYAIVLTDPHVLGDWYADGNKYADVVFGMQKYYLKPGEIHLPYCASPDHHYAMSDVKKEYDASLIGLHYEQRDRLVNRLRGEGFRVLYELGLVYDEYREKNNSATVGLNWSSKMDINARMFEAMAMKQVLLTNRLPHMEELGFEEGRNYLGFDTVEEAVKQMQWVRDNPELSKSIALCGHQMVHANHTYEKRVETIFEVMGL